MRVRRRSSPSLQPDAIAHTDAANSREQAKRSFSIRMNARARHHDVVVDNNGDLRCDTPSSVSEVHVEGPKEGGFARQTKTSNL
jgi:hypothetical protein